MPCSNCGNDEMELLELVPLEVRKIVTPAQEESDEEPSDRPDDRGADRGPRARAAAPSAPAPAPEGPRPPVSEDLISIEPLLAQEGS